MSYLIWTAITVFSWAILAAPNDLPLLLEDTLRANTAIWVISSLFISLFKENE